MRYEKYSVIDFINDDFFVKWVSTPDSESDFFWNKWIANHPEKLEEVRTAKTFIQNVHYHNAPKISKTDFTNIHENILRYKTRQDHYNNGRSWSGKSYLSLGIAASLAFTIIASILLFDAFNPSVQEVSEVSYVVKETPRGLKTTSLLPDGSKVKINSGSVLKYPERFEGENRRVILQGEAFFEVKADPDKPFVIESSCAVVQVLGTSFNVKTYDNDKDQRIAVVSGKVRVTTPGGKEKILLPDSMAVIDKNTGMITVTGYNKTEELGWCDGILYFNQTPFHKVFEKLEMWFAVSFEIDDRINLNLNETYTGEFKKNESLENVLNGIGYTSGFSYRIINKKVYVY